jgi:hypothetical protein
MVPGLHRRANLFTSMRWKTLVVAAVVALAADARADLYVTEFVALNVAGLTDEDGDHSDWLEIFNDGVAPVSVGGWYLTDDAAVLTKWQLPAVSVAAGGYLVVFASDKNRAVAGQQLHTNFKLSGGGEYLGLVRDDGVTIVHQYSPAFPAQSDDVSWGLTNNLAQQRCFTNPTPGAVNQESPTCGVVEPLAFAPPRGFYDSAQAVTISTATPGAQIYYTLDGTEPSQTNGTLYAAPVAVPTTATIRAVAFAAPLQPSVAVTHTYIFLEHVLQQTGAGYPTQGFDADYAMDPKVVDDPRYSSTILDDFRTIPSISIVMPVDDWWGPENGIYSHASRRGIEWERRASAEMIMPDGSTAWQINCGTRIQGRLSRVKNPKKSLRLAFKSEYGPPKLEYPMFSDSHVTSFNKLRLRASHGKSWSFGILRADYIRDQWARDTQIDMGQVSSHGMFAHVYLNGLYWGLYNVVELPEAEFAVSYYGGVEEEWDVLEPAEVQDGNRDSWRAALDIAIAGLESPAAYAQIKQYIDVVNLADYMMMNMHAGTRDWDDSNWYAGRRRLPGEGFKFWSWDTEQSMEFINARVTGVHHDGMPSQIYTALRANAEFRLLFADRVHRHFFNGGALTAAESTERYMERVAEIDRAVVPESARWGDSRTLNDPLDRDSNWIPEIEWLRLAYFPRRSSIVVQQFRDIDLYPSVVAPVFTPQDGFVAAGATVTMSAPAGTIYYTTDGADPRVEGGAVSPSAVSYSAPLSISTETVVRSRVLASGVWSALNEATYAPEVPLRVTEMMYHPTDPPSGPYVDDDFEFIEITNVGSAPVALGGMKFSSGITFTFPVQSLAPGAHVLVVKNTAAFPTRYGSGKPIAGQYGGKLANEGERIRLETVAGDEVHDFTFNDAWHPSSDGGGFSLVASDALQARDAWSMAAGWRASSFTDGSAGAAELPFCSDGLDNDGDTLADFGGDPGCASAAQNDERPACNDGTDNDDDALIDLADPHCTSASDSDEAGAPIDAFACFSARQATTAFAGTNATLDDELEAGRVFTVRAPSAVCAPAVIDGQGVLVDASTHLEGFSIRPGDGLDTPTLAGELVEGLGPLYVDTYEADRLLVPANVGGAPVGAPVDSSHALDRYKCYKAKASRAFPKLFPGGVVLRSDSTFESAFYDFKYASRVCNPVSINGSAIKNEGGKLLCYRGRRSRGQSTHVPQIGIHVTTELGATVLDTRRLEEICVPAR